MTKNPVAPSEQPTSPCIRNCCLDSQDICIGCLRSIDEIVGWSTKSIGEKQEILARCEVRKKQRLNTRNI
ncbi:DUF1289 domain-containing protein [Pseudoalteromonas umbrosa]|uniref:DUF1289 domain-containing protein n=1 Tax=Pseudoalteromonas umbrosa TaxID=3048489 RepID=UPI0024C2F7C7|nr:DUF1289 domain-containing protein [Pseudoalteromonas sp. B95]MDK1286907.1 DUF1289 domain-containing protein [Pseudoalteromonas sp. B95]